jgi:hypothetical protein
LLLFSVTGGRLIAQSCVTQAQMTAPDRDSLAAVARKTTADALSGDAGALRSNSTADLQRDFAGVAQAVTGLRDVQNATVTIRNLYLLDNSAAQPADDVVQFFCGAYNTPQHVTFSLPGLKTGRYAVAVVHVTGTDSPRQLSYVLQDMNGWKLAGFIAKPLQQGGHDGVWYWQRARELVAKHELWNAELSFLIAKQLLTPVGFLSSANQEKLVAEQQAARPSDWPTEEKPFILTADGKQVKVMEVAPLITPRNTADLSVNVVVHPDEAADASAASPNNQAIAKELVRKIPELREMFTLMVVTAVSSHGEPVSSVVSLKAM